MFTDYIFRIALFLYAKKLVDRKAMKLKEVVDILTPSSPDASNV